MSFGERIKYFAKSAYGSQVKFAIAIGMQPTQLNGYVAGRSVPSMEILQKFREGGLSLEWLFADESEVEQISMYANNETGRKLHKQATGKELPQVAEAALNADTMETLRQKATEILKLLT